DVIGTALYGVRRQSEAAGVPGGAAPLGWKTTALWIRLLLDTSKAVSRSACHRTPQVECS
ncbi:MAG TPA: hypothetical protein VES69_02915, partial [Pyrinomonadaceae bacterium]|nr:hypothetical protein [Pyrinomonadaceae bacterium]